MQEFAAFKRRRDFFQHFGRERGLEVRKRLLCVWAEVLVVNLAGSGGAVFVAHGRDAKVVFVVCEIVARAFVLAAGSNIGMGWVSGVLGRTLPTFKIKLGSPKICSKSGRQRRFAQHHIHEVLALCCDTFSLGVDKRRTRPAGVLAGRSREQRFAAFEECEGRGREEGEGKEDGREQSPDAFRGDASSRAKTHS